MTRNVIGWGVWITALLAALAFWNAVYSAREDRCTDQGGRFVATGAGPSTVCIDQDGRVLP